jgi:thioredoxin 1
MSFFAKLLGLAPKKMPITIDDANFAREVKHSKMPVLLDVWGPNCRACKQLEPIMMQLATDYDGRVKICEMNVQNAERTTLSLRIKGTPTVLYFRGGKELERVVGMHGSLYHEQTIEELFKIPKKADG